MMFLKSKTSKPNGFPLVTGVVLLEPETPQTPPIKCDADLYAAVAKHGKALLFMPDNTRKEVDPETFEREWRGD